LAALQSQEAFGNYNPKKHKASSGRHHGFLAEFLPTMLPEQVNFNEKINHPVHKLSTYCFTWYTAKVRYFVICGNNYFW